MSSAVARTRPEWFAGQSTLLNGSGALSFDKIPCQLSGVQPLHCGRFQHWILAHNTTLSSVPRVLDPLQNQRASLVDNARVKRGIRDLFFTPDTKVFEVDWVHMKKQIGGWPCGYIVAGCMASLALGKEDTAVGRYHFQESKLGADLEACLSKQTSRTSTIKSEFSHQVGRASRQMVTRLTLTIDID